MNQQIRTIETSIPGSLRAALRGVGQVFFQGSALSGICFLLGVALGSPLMALGGAIGAAIGTATARIAGFDAEEIADGIYGFNATLVGIATFFFFQPGAASFVLLLVGCVATTFLTLAMRRGLPFPTYTTPFILITWILFFVGPSIGASRVPAGEPAAATDAFRAAAHGVSQVMFQANLGTAALFVLGLALGDWRHAALVVFGSILGMLAASYHAMPEHQGIDPQIVMSRFLHANIGLGLYGYNATLTAVALFLARRSMVAVILGALLSVPITEHLPSLGLPALTAPFVLSTWIVLALAHLDDRCLKAKGAGAETA